MRIRKSIGKKIEIYNEEISSMLKNGISIAKIWKNIMARLELHEVCDYNTFYQHCNRNFDKKSDIIMNNKRESLLEKRYGRHRELILETAKKHGKRGGAKTFNELKDVLSSDGCDYANFIVYAKKDKEISEVLWFSANQKGNSEIKPSFTQEQVKQKEQNIKPDLSEHLPKIKVANFEKINRAKASIAVLNDVYKEMFSEVIMKLPDRTDEERKEIQANYLDSVEEVRAGCSFSQPGDLPMLKPHLMLFSVMNSMAMNPHYMFLIMAIYGDSMSKIFNTIDKELEEPNNKKRIDRLGKRLEMAQDEFMETASSTVMTPMDLSDFMAAVEQGV